MILRNKRFICSFLTLSLVVSQFQISGVILFSKNVSILAHASESDSRKLSLEPLTKQENYSKWQKYKDNSTENPYLENPSITNPFSIGKLNPTYIQGFLNIANFARYLSGLPDDLETNNSENTTAQYGAVISAGFDDCVYNPPQLEGMDDSFYKTAINSLNNSIILQSGQVSTHLSYMKMLFDDTFDDSLLTVHHRREILSPQMKYTGFGVADKSSRRYIVMKTYDKTRSPIFDYDAYAWPNCGYFPCEVISSGAPWTISLNPKKYDSTKINDIKVTVTRKKDGKTVVMDSSMQDTNSPYLNIITDTKKTEFTLVFRSRFNCYAGQEFDVKITGVYAVDSTPVEINYNVNIYSMSDPIDATPFPSPPKDASYGYISPDFVDKQTTTSDLKKGFTVQVKGSDKYSTTDESGYFELSDVPRDTGNFTLVIKKEGFLTREVVVISAAKEISSHSSPLYMWGGDTDGDDCINMTDVVKIATCFNSTHLDKEFVSICDVNQDNAINMHDVLIIATHFNCTSDNYNDFYR